LGLLQKPQTRMVVAGSLWAWTGCGSNVGSACSEHHAGCHHIAVGTGYASRRSTTACSSSTRPGEEVSGGFGEDDAPKSPLKRFHPAQLRKEIAAAVVCGDTGELSSNDSRESSSSLFQDPPNSPRPSQITQHIHSTNTASMHRTHTRTSTHTVRQDCSDESVWANTGGF
jgi:hypothetical protein